jgi:8-oxo-dGTP diphosphatase
LLKPAPLQFGAPEPDLKYRDRPAVFAVVERRGQIALICVSREGLPPIYDLPGGAIEPGESDARALAREVVEETGLIVHAGEELGRADQYLIKADGEPVINRCTLMTAVSDGYDPTQKVEDDHKLVWMSPDEALRILRLDSQAWAVACWIRRYDRRAKDEAAA